MSLDTAAINALAADLKTAKITCGAVDNPALTALCLAEAQAIAAFVKKATVVPTLLVAPTGGGPVTGTGTIT